MIIHNSDIVTTMYTGYRFDRSSLDIVPPFSPCVSTDEQTHQSERNLEVHAPVKFSTPLVKLSFQAGRSGHPCTVLQCPAVVQSPHVSASLSAIVMEHMRTYFFLSGAFWRPASLQTVFLPLSSAIRPAPCLLYNRVDDCQIGRTE